MDALQPRGKAQLGHRELMVFGHVADFRLTLARLAADEVREALGDDL